MKGPKHPLDRPQPRPTMPVLETPAPSPSFPGASSVSGPQQAGFLAQPVVGLAGSEDPIAAAMAARHQYELQKSQKALERQEARQARVTASGQKTDAPVKGAASSEPTSKQYGALRELKALDLAPSPAWARPHEELGISKDDTLLLGWVPERGLPVGAIASASQMPEMEVLRPHLALLAAQRFVAIEGDTCRLTPLGKEAISALRDRGEDVTTRLGLIDAQLLTARASAIESGSIGEWNRLVVDSMLTGGESVEVQVTKVSLASISACELMGDLTDPRNSHVEVPKGLRQVADAYRLQVTPEIRSLVAPDLALLEQSQAVFEHIARLRATESSDLETVVKAPETYQKALEGIHAPQTRTLHALAMASYQALDAALPTVDPTRSEASGKEAAAIGSALQQALYGAEACNRRTFSVLPPVLRTEALLAVAEHPVNKETRTASPKEVQTLILGLTRPALRETGNNPDAAAIRLQRIAALAGYEMKLPELRREAQAVLGTDRGFSGLFQIDGLPEREQKNQVMAILACSIPLDLGKDHDAREIPAASLAWAGAFLAHTQADLEAFTTAIAAARAVSNHPFASGPERDAARGRAETGQLILRYATGLEVKPEEVLRLSRAAAEQTGSPEYHLRALRALTEAPAPRVRANLPWAETLQEQSLAEFAQASGLESLGQLVSLEKLAQAAYVHTVAEATQVKRHAPLATPTPTLDGWHSGNLASFVVNHPADFKGAQAVAILDYGETSLVKPVGSLEDVADVEAAVNSPTFQGSVLVADLSDPLGSDEPEGHQPSESGSELADELMQRLMDTEVQVYLIEFHEAHQR